MPIYAYRCESCGYTQDVLQKLSDAPLKACPHCGAPTFKKQVTAAAFRLKGSGWYVTDFRNEGTSNGKAEDAAPDKKADGAHGSNGAPAEPHSPAASHQESGPAAGGEGKAPGASAASGGAAATPAAPAPASGTDTKT